MCKLIIGLMFVSAGACGGNVVSAEEQSAVEVTRSGNEEGRTVMLVPGLASSADVWAETRTLLEADYDVRTVQVAGFAGVEPVAFENMYTDAIVKTLIAELEANPGNETVLVGHSMGGFVSMKAALVAPELVDELVIVDSVPFLAGLFFPGTTPQAAAVQAPLMASQLAGMSREAFDAQQKVGLGRLVKTQDFLPILESWAAASDQATVSAVTGELLGTDLRADLSDLDIKTLIMVPYDSAMGTSREQIAQIYKAQYEAAPNARIEIFDESFHFIMIDQADTFHESLLETLAN